MTMKIILQEGESTDKVAGLLRDAAEKGLVVEVEAEAAPEPPRGKIGFARPDRTPRPEDFEGDFVPPSWYERNSEGVE
jgi:hypothetical protein